MRTILITGANGGLGRAIARAFLDESPSNSVWLGLHTRREYADALAREFPDRCRCIPLDVTAESAWKVASGEIISTTNRIDVLVNNAGRAQDGLLANLSASAWNSVIAESLTGVFLGCQTVLSQMIAQRHGRIINIASLSAILSPPGQTNYAAAKAGVIALTQSLAKEVARIGITVNAICPGYIETEALDALDEAERTAARQKIPMRRFGQPNEVAAAVRFLACPEASYITGSVLKVDGGII